MEGFIAKIFNVANEALTGTGGLLKDGVNALVDVFVIKGTDGAITDLTLIGYCMAMGLGVGAIYFLFRLIKGWLSRVKG